MNRIQNSTFFALINILSTTRDLLVVLDAITALTERIARAEVTLVQNQAILLQIQTHLGLSPVSVTEPTQPITRDQSTVSASAASLDMLEADAVASNPPASPLPQ